MTSSADAPVRVLASAPSALPVAVRLTLLRYIFGSRLKEAVVNILFALVVLAAGSYLVATADQTLHSRRYGDMDGHLVGWACIAIGVFVLGYLPFAAARQLKDGFSAGADASGVYLRPNLDKNRVLFLPWSAVETVRVATWRGPQLVVKPRDHLLEAPFELVRKGRCEEQLGTEIAQKRRLKRLGTNIHAPVPGVDRIQLLNDLRYQAAGRAPVELPGGNPVMMR
jgi:hypothetical protein